jgi:hypothetical protein
MKTDGKRHALPQSLNAALKSICDIMRRSSCAGAPQYVPELTWILFLRILDEHETREADEAEALGLRFKGVRAQALSLARLGRAGVAVAPGQEGERLEIRSRGLAAEAQGLGEPARRAGAAEGHQRNHVQRGTEPD